MGMTIAEKIIAAAAGVDYVKPGDIHTVTLDRMMSNDGTTHLTVDMYRNKLKHPHIADTKKMVFIVDHNVPSDCPKTAASQKKMRDFAKENNIDFWEGKGVCHQVMMENYVCPGELIFGADSHTCSYGALGAFGTGVGCTDLLYGMVTGKSWVLVPETVKFNLVGKLPEGVYARDLILTIIGTIGANGCNYQVMEFTGEGAKTLSISERMVLCNMAVEAGAKTGIFEPDEKAIEYLEAHGRKPKALFTSDPDAVYAREYTFDLSKIRPVVAKPDFVDNLVPAEEVRGVKIDEAFLGSCNNGRIEDLRVGASIIKGKKVAEKVRFLVVPASQTVYLQALKEGLIDAFMEAGAIVMNPNCSVCWGSCQGVIGENEVLISTGTRNFKGRAGHPSSKVYLGSAATVTASAIKGEIALAYDLLNIEIEDIYMEKMTGKVWVLGDDIDTDIIIPTEYLALKTIDDMKQYGFSPLRPELAAQIKPGDIIVAGKNFGCGSSREQAPEIIKALGIQCVIAKSFARIFFRNSINNGLLLIEQPTLHDDIKEGDTVSVVMNEHIDYNGKEYPIASLPENLMDIIRAGGLVKAMRKLNGLD